MYLGCIGDDFTGSSDLGNMLTKAGMHVVQYSGIPDMPAAGDVDAGIVALKSRSIPVDEAIAQSLAALDWLQAQGCEQFFFKYCSTFDSTPEGNIGQVAMALAERLSAKQVIFCPAFPTTGRSIYQGHLFVGQELLSDSPLKDHPLNPMTESDLRKWLALQTGTKIGHVAYEDVRQGDSQVRQKMADEAATGRNYMIVDAINDEDLMVVGKALKSQKLVTGGSGIAIGLPQNFDGLAGGKHSSQNWTGEAGKCVAICGSCAAATRAQIAAHKTAGQPVLSLDSAAVITGEFGISDALAWAEETLAASPDAVPLIYSSAEPEEVRKIQQEFGRELAAEAFESFFGALAVAVVNDMASRLIVAGGETSGAVVEALGLPALIIGPEIDPGVPALRGGPALTLALKSGNFGAEDFFLKAADCLAGK